MRLKERNDLPTESRERDVSDQHDQMVSVSQAYLDKLEADNARLRVAMTNLVAAAEWLLDDCETSDMRQYAVDALAAAKIAKATP